MITIHYRELIGRRSVAVELGALALVATESATPNAASRRWHGDRWRRSFGKPMGARGVTQELLSAAADELLAEGAKPTIEKVRLKIGSGSPNTVNPMPNAWFASLHKRIQDPQAFATPTAPSEVPDPILEAATRLWEAAIDETREDFDERLHAQLIEGMEAALANVESKKERAELAQQAAFSAEAHSCRLEIDLSALTTSFEAEVATRAAVKALLDTAEGRIEELTALGARRSIDEAGCRRARGRRKARSHCGRAVGWRSTTCGDGDRGSSQPPRAGRAAGSCCGTP